MCTECCLTILLAVLPFFSFVDGAVICPLNETSWHQRAKIKCHNTSYYHCLPTIYLNESREICQRKETIQTGFCAVYMTDTDEVTFNSASFCSGNGKEFTGCPGKAYRSNETYLYPSCLEINPVQACYLADSSCPNITGSTSGPEGSGTSNARQLSPPYLLQCVQYVFTKVLYLTLSLYN